jgi:hypothetical protein
MSFASVWVFLLEVAPELHDACRAYRLVTTIVETVAMFKITPRIDSLASENMMKRAVRLFAALRRAIASRSSRPVPKLRPGDSVRPSSS